MSRAAPFGAGARALLRELGLLARSGPFRLALVLSVLLHLGLLVFTGGWGRGGPARTAPLMRVRIVAAPSAPLAAPGAPEIAPGVPQVPRESLGRRLAWRQSRPRMCF